MAAKQVNPLPLDFHLWSGCIVRVTAIDPTTGDPVAGVKLSSVSLEVQNMTGGNLEEGVFQVVNPVLVPEA